ncbi:MAG: 16S rRNA (cytosine(1402)-N(4))-methyltransferase, partial [Chloroflexi bacterium]|nr:16S rRNA (cytosine(1402)-N(4))-methyltransferase [Chloroflexota bacterium]
MLRGANVSNWQWIWDGTPDKSQVLNFERSAIPVLAGDAPDGWEANLVHFDIATLPAIQDDQEYLNALDELVALARDNLKGFDGDLRLVNANFRDLEKTARKLTFVPVHGVLFDLGISSMQLAEDGRGFSFQTEAALDMRFSPDQELTAADIVNGYDESEIANLIWEYGEERFSRRIAKAIVRTRPLQTTTALASVVAKAVPGRGKIHPATRTFQALRIAVN